MNRVQSQNDDLRKMQQEAMRRVQEMQNKSQGYMRAQSGYNSIYNVSNEQEITKHNEHEFEKPKDKPRQSKQAQRTKMPPSMAQMSPAPPIHTAEAEDIDDCGESDCPCEQEPVCDAVQTIKCCDKDSNHSRCEHQEDNGNNSDIILIIAIILILNGNKNNYALMLALLSLLI